MPTKTDSGLLTNALPAAGPLSFLPLSLEVVGWLLSALSGHPVAEIDCREAVI